MATKKASKSPFDKGPNGAFDYTQGTGQYDPHMADIYSSHETDVAKYKAMLNAKAEAAKNQLIADMYGALPLSHKPPPAPAPPTPTSPYHTGTVPGAGSILGTYGAPGPMVHPSPFWKDTNDWEKTLGDDNAFIKMFRESSLNPELKGRFDKFAKDWIKAATGMQKRIKDLESENQTLSNQAAEEKNVWAKYPFKTLTAAKIEESVRENNSLLDRMAAKLEKLK